MTKPNFRALCAELIKIVEEHCNPDDYALCDVVDTLRCARTALTTPPPEPPADGEVAELAALIRQCALAWEPDARLLGNMTAAQLVRAAELLERTATPPPEPPTDVEALAARPLLEQVARLGDCIGANTVGKIMAISSRAAAWLEANPPGQPVAIEPRGCPTPGACSCVEPATPPPEPLRPIPVSERLPGPGDCAPWPGQPDATPWCWAGKHFEGVWEWAQISMLGLSAHSLRWCIAGGGWSHWLPYNAIPFPEVTP